MHDTRLWQLCQLYDRSGQSKLWLGGCHWSKATFWRIHGLCGHCEGLRWWNPEALLVPFSAGAGFKRRRTTTGKVLTAFVRVFVFFCLSFVSCERQAKKQQICWNIIIYYLGVWQTKTSSWFAPSTARATSLQVTWPPASSFTVVQSRKSKFAICCCW